MAKILLAEDDDSMRNFLTRSIERAGHMVVAVSSGERAMPFVEAETFDLLLTDIVMPEMDGIELAQKAVAILPELKVMFITGFAAVALNERNAAPKNSKILSKPFHLKDIVGEIERLLAA